MKYLLLILTPLVIFFTSCSAQTISTSFEKGYIDTHVHLREMKEGGPQGIMQNAKFQNKRPEMRPGNMNRGEGLFKARSGRTAKGNLLAKMDKMGVEEALIVVVPSDHSSHAEEYASMKKLNNG